jgi:putative transposase
VADGCDYCQNELTEWVNGILQNNRFLFLLPDDLAQARRLVKQAVYLCNEERPHLAQNYLTPKQVHQQGRSPVKKI